MLELICFLKLIPISAHEELIPNADKKDFGIYAMSHVHTSKWDILLGLRTDN